MSVFVQHQNFCNVECEFLQVASLRKLSVNFMKILQHSAVGCVLQTTGNGQFKSGINKLEGRTFLGSVEGLQRVRVCVIMVPLKAIGKICRYQRFKQIDFQKSDFNVVLEGKCYEMIKACNKAFLQE